MFRLKKSKTRKDGRTKWQFSYARSLFVMEAIILDDEKLIERTSYEGIERLKKIGWVDREVHMGSYKAPVVLGEDAFFLCDSMGIHVDLMEIVTEEEGMTVDMKGYQECMRLQSDRSKTIVRKVVAIM